MCDDNCRVVTVLPDARVAPRQMYDGMPHDMVDVSTGGAIEAMTNRLRRPDAKD